MISVWRAWFRKGWLALVLLGSAVFPTAGSPWFARVWQADDGLPGDNVTGVVQSRDGFLWIATQSGLARFDGINLQSVALPKGRPRPIIRAMLLDRDEGLWLAEEGGVLVHMAPGDSSLFSSTNGLSKAQAVEMVQTGDRAVWLAYADGSVCRLADGKVAGFAEGDGLPGMGSCSLAVDSADRLWFAKGGQAGTFQDGKFIAKFTLPDRNIQVGTARGHGVWICAGTTLYRYASGEAPVEVGTLAADATSMRPTCIYEDRSGAVWVGTANTGLYRFDGTNATSIETSHGRIRSVMEDREGNIWVGTDGGGLNRLRPRVVELQGKDAGLPFDTVRSVCEDHEGNIWLVTQNGEVASNEGGEWKTISSTPAWVGGQATCTACDASGRVWIGTYSHGLFYRTNDMFRAMRRADGLAGPSLRSLHADRDGSLWVAFSSGNVLQRLHQGEFKNYELPNGSRAVRAMAQDAAGTIWMANLDAQLLRVEGDKILDETARTGDPTRPIRCLAGTTDGSLWIGYSSAGVGRLKKEQFTLIGQDQGLRDSSICSLMPDGRGWMWFGSDHGIFRASENELTAVADGKASVVQCVGYGRDDRLPSIQGYYGYSPGAALGGDGRILIPTHSGLAIVHPERVRTNSVPPHVMIESVMVDSQPLILGQSKGPIPLPPGIRKVEVDFSAPSFIEPEKVAFRYRLDGWDDAWVDAGSLRKVVYSRLPEGRYRFQVTAGNNSGIWNPAGASFEFMVQPLFWETATFRVIAAVILAGILVATVYTIVRVVSLRRIRARLRRLEQENALERERARIARDIHDDLGARMTQISLLTDLASQAMNRPKEAGDHLAQIATASRQGIKSLDEIIWAVNPRNDTLVDLLDYSGQYAVDFLGSAGIRCRVNFPNLRDGRELSAEMRHSLFLGIKEALHNVAKHSRATEVRLDAEVSDRGINLTIEDNGRGFNKTPDDALADGLRNMRQRLAQFGGVCSIEGRPGMGARIRFEVPWRN